MGNPEMDIPPVPVPPSVSTAPPTETPTSLSPTEPPSDGTLMDFLQTVYELLFGESDENNDADTSLSDFDDDYSDDTVDTESGINSELRDAEVQRDSVAEKSVGGHVDVTQSFFVVSICMIIAECLRAIQ